MFYKSVLFYILLLSVLYITIHSRKREYYNNYKSIVVTPQSTIYKNLTISTWHNSSLYVNLANNLSGLFPIANIVKTGGSVENIYNVEKSKNMLGLVQDDTLYNYAKENPNTNVRYITMLGLEQITAITLANSNINSWNDIKNKRIGTFGLDSGSYKTLDRILSISRDLRTNQIVSIDIDNNGDSIIKKLVNKEIDLFFGIVSNPDPIFNTISKKYPIKILGVDGIDTKLLKIALPYYRDAIIDTTEYKVVSSKTIHTLQTGISLICHKELDPLDSYLLIKTLFGNFSYIKNNGDNTYKSQMFEFSPTYLYNVNYSVDLHSGIRKYLKDINLITTNSNEDCIYKVGIEPCKIKYTNSYRLL